MPGITKTNVEALFEPQIIQEIIEGVTKQSAVLSMFRRLPNMTTNKTKMRVLDALPLAYWVDAKTNNGRKKLTSMAWENKFITAEEIAVIVPIKEDVLDDVNYDIWADVRPRLVEAFGKKIDDAVLLGVDKPSGFREDLLTSIINAGAEITQDTGNSETLYSAINRAMVKVEESGYSPSGIIGGVDVKGEFRMMLDTTGQPIKGTEIDSLPKSYVDNGVWDKTKARMVIGDFSQAVYAIRQDITYKILDQAIIQDPSDGSILYNLAQEDMVALRVVMRLGWEIPNPINALKEDESVRFPFASIKGSSGVTTQNVTFTVTDTGSDPVVGAKITVNGVVKKTNSSGQAVFKLQAGVHDYVVKKDDALVSGSVTVVGSSVSVSVTNF